MEQSSLNKDVRTGRAVIPVVFQIFLLVLPFLLAGGVFMWWKNREMFEEERLKFGKTLLMEAAVIEAAQLDEGKFRGAKTDAVYFQDRISAISGRFEPDGSEQNTEKEYRTDLLYGYFATEQGQIYRILDMGAKDEGETEWIKRCVQSRGGICASYDKEEGQYLALYIPVFSKAGQVAGVVKCSLETEGFSANTREMARRISRPAILCFSVIVLVIMIMLMFFLRPVRQLKFFLQEVGEQGKTIHLRGRGQNEISELLEILSRMSENIHEYMREVRRLQEQYRAFVPEELVQLLGKSDIREVNAGDAALCEGTLAVIHMGAFARLEADCPAEELFERINLGLAQMIPEIEESHGQILRFFQGGLMVLFPGEGGGPVNCIGRVLQNLREKTRDAYYAALDYKKIHLELAGDDSRLQFTVRGEDWEDIQNLAQLAQKHGLMMVGGAGLAQKLKEEQAPLFVRSLGKVILRSGGNGEGETELIEFTAEKRGNAEALIRETAGLFQQGIREYYLGHFRESREHFAEILRKNHEDRAAQRYFILCDQHLCGEGQGKALCFDWIG